MVNELQEQVTGGKQSKDVDWTQWIVMTDHNLSTPGMIK